MKKKGQGGTIKERRYIYIDRWGPTHHNIERGRPNCFISKTWTWWRKGNIQGKRNPKGGGGGRRDYLGKHLIGK